MNQTRQWQLRTGRFLTVGLLVVSSSCHNLSRGSSSSGRIQIIPVPQSLVLDAGAPFVLSDSTRLLFDGGAEAQRIAESLATLLRPSTGYSLPVLPASGARASSAIRLVLHPSSAPATDESYELTAAPAGILISAPQPAGLFRGVQTLRQLFPADVESHIGDRRPTWIIPAVTIQDAPRFAWRGAMLDVARHFFTVKEVKQFIDMAALYKLNVLHLHLADDQGWRIAIDSRPRLTGMGSSTQVGGGEGGFYTQAEYSDLVRYAAARYITVVPEIDMPGHANAAFIGYPDVSCGSRAPASYSGSDVGWSTFCVDSEASYALVDDIVREIAALTPGKYFHVGGDEVTILTHPQYVKFIERVQDIVSKHGKQMIGWEEITKARLLPTTIAQQWKSDSVRAALQYGSKILLSPANRTYLDMKYTPATELGLTWAGYVDLRTAYDWDPATYLTGVQEKDLVGIEAEIWSETVRNIGAVSYLALPRLPALAEVGWSSQRTRNFDEFRDRVAAHSARWNYLGMNFYRSPEVAW